jgi:uncharacterized protein (TIGR03437 family)
MACKPSQIACFFACLALIILFVISPPASAQSAPEIYGIFPGSGAPVGARIAVMGANFGEAQGSGSVSINGQSASITSWADTFINVLVPQGAISGPVVVTVDGNASNAVPLAVLPPDYHKPVSLGWAA